MAIRYGRLEDLPVKVICPECRAENQLPDSLDRKTTYKCHACQTRFDRISRINFGKVAIVMLIIWWLVPVLVWASRPIITSSKGYSSQGYIGLLFLWSPVFLFPLVVLATAFFMWQGFLHRKFTGASPKGFRAYVCASIVGFSGFAAGIGLFIRYVVAATN